MKNKKSIYVVFLCVMGILLSACSAGNRQDVFRSWQEDAAPIAALEEYV